MNIERGKSSTRRKTLIALAVQGFAALSLPAMAEQSAAPAAAPAAARPAVDGEKILQLLVAKGVISQTEADALIAQAASGPAAAAATANAETGVQTVPYIPEPVRKQIKDELRAELASQAEADGWARPGEIPEWTRRLTLSGDLRVRGEGIFFDDGNDPDIVNFSALNSGAPFNINRDVAGSVNPPFLNTLDDRSRERVRARLALDARLDTWIVAQLRVATGSDSSPVSTNQTLGGGNSDFSKYSIWLDRANVQLTPLPGLKIALGRAENPFWTSELLFDNDLNFDGTSLRYKRPVASSLTAFGTFGGFPVYNTDLNFGSRDAGSFGSRDRWLVAGQLGAEFAASSQAKITLAVGYFDFMKIQGKTSSPCAFNQDVCDTDNSRPLFEQYGNSLYPVRAIVPDPAAPPGLSVEPQYFGLVSKFRLLEAHGAVDLTWSPTLPVRIEGEFVKNLAFDGSRVRALQSNVIGPYDPGDIGWFVNVVVGRPVPAKLWEWNLSAGYKHLESDAVVDGFTDSDFHLGGTNTQGFILGGAFGIGNGVSLGLRYLSADEITGQSYSVDVLQLDLNAKF